MGVELVRHQVVDLANPVGRNHGVNIIEVCEQELGWVESALDSL